jgi:2,4-dienoyl-CoA reductase (NADPH2)
MGSMHTGLEDRRRDYGKLARYFAERAAGGVGLIVTGGIAPNRAGWVAPFAGKLSSRLELGRHRLVTNAVHAEGGRVCMQILHAGRYGYHPFTVAPSAIRAPISPFRPRALSAAGVERQIRAFVRCASLARQAGYDGVEIMGSEGYLINQFLVKRTNQRSDDWGGTFEHRMRFPIEIVRRTRAAVGPDFILIFRLSMLDLISDGSDWAEIEQLALAVQEAGASIINTGIGWHEARIPTIATSVPRGAFTWVSAKLRPRLSIPLVTTNRINTPEVAEQILADGHADMVSMARPFLADPEFVRKAREGRSDEINTCIACNQACLDHVFVKKRASCLVNPRACHETEMPVEPTAQPRRFAVVGAGPAGLACATTLARRGHRVTLFEAAPEIGGQFNMAKRIPGKEEFHETLRYFQRQLQILGVELRLGQEVGSGQLLSGSFDEIVVATGVSPRKPPIRGVDHPKVMSYVDLLTGRRQADGSVAIIGAGGIGFDVATYLTGGAEADGEQPQAFLSEWGVDRSLQARGGILGNDTGSLGRHRSIYLLQRKASKPGKGLGKTTGWIHRTALKRHGVEMMSGVSYDAIDDRGLHVRMDGKAQTLEVDHVVICAGQESRRDLATELESGDCPVHIIGGAHVAAELDAKRAINEATRLALRL